MATASPRPFSTPENSRRAEYYRVWEKVTGVDTEYLAAASMTDSDVTVVVPSILAVGIRRPSLIR